MKTNGHKGLALPAPRAVSHRREERNDSTVPFGSGSCCNGIPLSAAKGGALRG